MTPPLCQKVKRNERASRWGWRRRVNLSSCSQDNRPFVELWVEPSVFSVRCMRGSVPLRVVPSSTGAWGRAGPAGGEAGESTILSRSGGVKGLSWSRAGNLSVPLEWDRCVGILKSRDGTLSTKVCLAKAVVFPVVVYGCESWTLKKAECRRSDAFELWFWRRLLSVPWTARRSNQSILKEINTKY